MKKIPTLFQREFDGGKVKRVTEKVTPGMEWVLDGKGVATVKIDGSCCAIIDGRFYKRYDAKRGKKPPEGAIPCGAADTVTGHWPHWVEVKENAPEDKWFIEAYRNSKENLQDATYEAIGPHFQNNPYQLKEDVLEQHGRRILEEVPRDFEGIRNYLHTHCMEGIVFWKDGQPQCKIKRTDFGYTWPVETGCSEDNGCPWNVQE